MEKLRLSLAQQPEEAGDWEEEAEEVPWEAASPGLMRGVVTEREREEWREEDALLGCPVSVMGAPLAALRTVKRSKLVSAFALDPGAKRGPAQSEDLARFLTVPAGPPGPSTDLAVGPRSPIGRESKGVWGTFTILWKESSQVYSLRTDILELW